jgi:hypothetical protein
MFLEPFSEICCVLRSDDVWNKTCSHCWNTSNN